MYECLVERYLKYKYVDLGPMTVFLFPPITLLQWLFSSVTWQLNEYNVPGIDLAALDAKNTAVKIRETNPCPCGAHVLLGRERQSTK